jgi:hypothetical protein
MPVMAPRDAVLSVLRAGGGPLHWTVIQDRALRTGAIDPLVTRDVRSVILGTLRELVRDGLAVKTDTGVYALA